MITQETERFHNQTGIIAEHLLNKRYTIIGAGAIGSFLTMTLAKMGGKDITVYDDDTIEDHNIANQMYPVDNIGMKKVDALYSVIRKYGDIVITDAPHKWEAKRGDAEVSKPQIVISCVDSMDVRKEIWDYYKNTSISLFMDGRMGAQTLRAYCIDMSKQAHKDMYEKTLYSSADAVQDRCTAKSIIYTVLMVSGIMLNQLKKYLNGERYPVEIVYDAVTDILIPTRI